MGRLEEKQDWGAFCNRHLSRPGLYRKICYPGPRQSNHLIHLTAARSAWGEEAMSSLGLHICEKGQDHKQRHPG